MPSEAQEPRDRGPAPPVTRAGRSAQLAKAAATSPGPERRSRGRPRKDGSSSRSAPPPPPPPPKSRKKGRSRGRAQVEDEEDATEKKPPQRTEVKEKTKGHRHSTYRRKSITNPEPDSEPDPEPSQDCISPEPESTVPESSPEPAPDPEEHRTRLTPSPVPMEMEVGVASPCPSLPVSPRLEDEYSLSPLFQLSEDSGGSPRLGHTKTRLKQCAFCYRGDEPPLGQGQLVVFGPTPGYIPLHILNRRASSDRDNDCHDHCYRGDQAPPMCSSPELCESSSEFIEQLGPIGLPPDINVQSLFDPTGQCCAHLQCAAWSEGVCRGEGQSLLYVDKAIDSGSMQVCAFCHRLGASLRCREMSCGRSFHFPCAAAAGAQQDWSQRHTLCSRHTHPVSSHCVLCSSGSDVSDLLMCCCCGNCYHGSCLDPPLVPSPLCRAGWQCPQCRVCQSCRLRGDDGVLLVCERCDKAYHTHCLTPPLDHTPSTSWICKNCRICRRCGVRSSGQWANHPFLCETCDPALSCPLCDLYTPQDYLTCICCYRCVHTECVDQAGEGRAGYEDFICSTCRSQIEEPVPHSPTLALSLSPSQAPLISISQSPIHTEAPPISPTAHSPVHLIWSDPPQSPNKNLSTPLQLSLTPPHPEITELQRSPAPPHRETTELQRSPAPSHPDPTELQQSPAPSHPDPTELQQSPAPSHPDPTELQQSPAPSHPDPTELQQSPAPFHPETTELQQSTAPSHPETTELHRSPAPSHPDPTELQQSPASSHPETTELQRSPAPSHPETTELQRSPAPSHPDLTELQQSPAPSHPDPTELQQSPAPSHPDPTELQRSPAPSHPDPKELQQSPAPSHPDPTELQQSPAPSHPDSTELQQSPAPSHPDPTELQQSPAPSHPDSTELQQSPASSHPDPTELQQSPVPSHSDPTELQHSPVPPQPDPKELQQSPAPSHPDPTELQQSPAPSHPDPKELQQSPAPSHPDPTELQHSPVPPHPDPTELQHSPAPSHPDTTELQQSPVPPHPDPKELQLSLVPSHPDPTELQQSPVPSHPDPTELQQSPVPSHPDPRELQHSPVPSHPDPRELQHRPVPSHPDPKELQLSLVPSHPDPRELQQSPAPSHPEPAELQQIPAPSHPEPAELQQIPAPSHPEPAELQQIPAPSHPEPAELQQIPPPSHFNGKEFQKSPLPPHPGPTELQEHPASFNPDPTEHHKSHTISYVSPAELQQSLAHVTSLQAQHSPCQLSYTYSSPNQNSTVSQQSPTQGSPMSCSHPHSPPPHTPTQAGLSTTQIQAGLDKPDQSPPPHSLAQDTSQTQLDRPCNPYKIIITQPQHSPPQRQHNPTPHSPAQVGTSPPQSPSQHAKRTLDQESPGSRCPAELRCGSAQGIPTLDQDLSTVCSRSTQTTRRHTSLRPISAPCSPSPSPLRATQCSLSQPSSPGRVHSTQPFRPLQFSLLPSRLASQSKVTNETSNTELNSMEHSQMQLSSNLHGQTLESSPTHLGPTCNLSTMPLESHGKLPNQHVPVHRTELSPAMPTPESLLHISTSMEHSSLTCSPCADETEESPPPASYIHPCPSCGSPLCSTEVVEGKASPMHIQNTSTCASPIPASMGLQMPTSLASSIQACACPMPVENSPAHISPIAAETSPSTQPVSPATLPAGDLAQSIDSLVLAPPISPSSVLTGSTYPITNQDKEMGVDVDYPIQFIHSETSTSHPNSNLDSRVETSPVHTEAYSGHSLMGAMHAVCNFSELAQTDTIQSPSHVRTTCSLRTSPVQTSPLPTPASFSPPHCRPTDTSPASISVSNSLSHGQRSSCTANIADVSQSPSRSSPAGQASPVHIQSTSTSAHSGPVQRQTLSLASTTCSSHTHATVTCVSSPHSPAQASETYHSPHYSPIPNTETSSDLAVAQLSQLASSSLDMDMVASSIIQVSVLPSVVQRRSGLVKPTDSIRPMSTAPASTLPDDSPAVSPNQASLSQVNQFQARPLPSPDSSAVESQQSPAPGLPLYQRPATPADATSTLARSRHACPVHSSPTQDNTAMPSTSHISEMPASPPPSSPSQVSVPHAQQAQGSSAHSSPVASPVGGPMQSGNRQVNPSPTSPLWPESRPSPGPGGPLRCEASSGPDSAGQSETSPTPGPTSHLQPDAGPSPGGHSVSSPQTHTAERESAATVDISVVEEQKEELREAPQQEEVQELHQTTKESPEEEAPADRTQGGGEPDQEEKEHSSSNCPPSGVSPHYPPQPTPPHSALPPPSPPDSHLPSPPDSPLPSPPASPLPSPPASPLPSPPASPLPSPPDSPLPSLPDSPLPSPPGAGSLEAPPHRTALLPSCSPHTSCPQEKEPTNRREAACGEVGGHVTSVDDDSQSQSQFELVAAATEPTKENQSHAEPSEREEGAEQEDQSDMEELELDPSLDMEVMALMTSSSPPPSLLHLPSPSPPPLSRRGTARTLRPPPCSSRPLDDLSIRLRQSPFSTEASPETSPSRAPLTPSPPLRYSPPARESPPLSKAAPPLTVLPLTPKIGMGKPAISKRKFSPRARPKQGSWWSNRRAVSPPSSSQDSMGEGGWDSPKPRPPDSPLWSMRTGRGSGFPGRRRSRGGGIGGGRGGRGRSRLKTPDCPPVSPGGAYVEPFQPKEEEENSMHNTVVMFSTSDHFTLRQDMCVVCGSFGRGAEGRLLACSQCGQCYHPYCVSVKITRVVLTKGWRCLECTVCEACGEASDPGRLLLCDDCDISYHTYCLDPPLQTVPKGAWKCKWCVWCVQCGSSSPGLHSDWMNNFSVCGPCSSLSCCPVCQRAYTHDELILQCQQCDRWVHAVCQGLNTEDEVEFAADEGFDCSLCQTHNRSSYGRSESPYMAQIVSRIREHDTKMYTQDGVCLTESGLSHLQSLVEPLMSPRRYRRCKPKLKLRIINQNSVSVLQTPPDPDPPTEHDPSRGDLECEMMKSDSSPERDHAHYDDVTKEAEVTDGNKKRKRKPYRPGIGGFMVRQRGGKVGSNRIKLSRKDSTEMLAGRDEDVSMETVPPAEQTMEKVKKRYRKKKTKLEEAFPSYLQEAFFGRDLLDRSRQVDRRPGTETAGASQSGAATDDVKGPAPSSSALLPGAMVTNAIKKPGTLPMSEEALLDLSDVLNTDPHILATGHTGQERSLSPFAGLDISSMADDLTIGGRGQRAVQEEPLDAILNPELDKMVTDGAILGKLYKIPELEGKDVEEVFTAVLSPNRAEQRQHTHTAAGSKTHTHHAAAVFPRLPLMNGLMGAAPRITNSPMMPSGAQSPAGFRIPPPESPAPVLASANQVSAGEGEQDVMSTAQRGMLKWEKEETLGEMATVAPVLYCNTNFPQLREQHPDWSTRVKQIAKLWRKASSQDRAPFVQKARDNRAAQRINKVQLSNDPLKRHQPSQQQPPLPPQPGPYDPVSMETEFKDLLRPKESEQEQEWKFRQIMRQKSKQQAKMEATQKLEQVKSEQLLQQRQQQLSSPDAPATSSLLLTDDVFLRPQAPPPSSPLPPSSPQMFSPPSSRPSSPWDPYSKGAGTPRPTSSQTGGPPQQRHTSLCASPSHDVFGSPAPSPDSKTSDVSRTLGPPAGVQQSRTGMLSPSPGGVRGAEFQRSPHGGGPHGGGPMRAALCELYGGRGSELVQGGLFKAPMPPQHQPQQEVGGGRRPTDLGFALPQSQDPPFPSSPLSGLGSPHRSPYAQAPGTPRPDYSLQMADPFAQHSPLTSRPSPDPYANPQTPGTPRPHSDPTYLPTPPALRLDQYNQQSAGRRPSPSHPNLEAYASNPGTPRSSVAERFPRSPGSQRSTDPYAQQPSTPRPQKAPDPFSQAPVESFTPQPAGPASSPLVPGLPGDTVTFTPTHHQSPGRQQQDSFPRTPSSQTPKHPGISEESVFLAGQTPGHDLFEQGHMTPGPLQAEKATANEMAALASLDGPMSMLPQLGDSEEKLRQRQRLRQLILRQQQQKSALRQEKGLQEAASGHPAAPPGPSPGSASATPRHWSQVDPSSTPPADLFGRPPPPYPGSVRPGGAVGGFPGEQQRGFTPREPPFSRQGVPRELGVRGAVLRFGAPPGAPAGLQDTFLRPPQGSVPVSGLSLEGVPVQMRRPVSGDFTGIRPLPAASVPPHMVPGVPQPFPPRSLPLQQHSIMGQPYIELRHRAPENRLRLSFSLPAGPNPKDVSAARPGQGARPGEVAPGRQVVMEQLNQQHPGHTTAAQSQSAESTLPGTEGMEEHLEGEDSAVKDLEDVEVKDLVDLNLNLDPEDGKEDLDLGPNDLHLDDFLLSGKFDLIAYADPELNLEDKKDMFNEELDLGEPVEEGGDGSRKSQVHLIGQVKQEGQDGSSATQHPAPQPGVVTTTGPPGPPGATGSSQPSLQKVENSGSGASLVLQTQEHAPSSGVAPRVHPPMAGAQQSVFQQQRPFGPSALFPPPPQGPLSLQPPQSRLLLNAQTQLPHPGTSTQSLDQNQEQDQDQHRPLLLEEQPLLLQELLDQERQEQQQQKQMQALIRQRSPPDSVVPNMADFDSISDPIMKAKMVALKGINKVMTQGSMGLNPMVINRFQQAPAAPAAEGTTQPPHLVGQEGKLNPQMVRPSPPSFGPGFNNESQRRQYEEWLGETQQLLQMQQRLLEDQIAAHRKTKKSLSAKQRTAKKAGRALAEEDATQLRNISEQQGAVQKQLEQIRKQQKDHAELIEDYRTKQQRAGAPHQTVVSMQPHPGGPTPACVPNVPPGWTPGGGASGGGAPGLMGQRMPLHLPSALPKAPPNTQTPKAMVPGLAAPTAGFNGGPRGPSGGPSGAAGDAPPQVKFDDNNPFSEGFQERERRERLREQQERQRVQLMQEVERHRALQQRLELEQHGLLGASLGPGAGVAAVPPSGAPLGAGVGPTPGPGGAAGSAAVPGGDALSQLPFFSSELPQDFLQSSPASRPPLQRQAQQAGLHQGFTGGPRHPGAHPAPGVQPGVAAERGRSQTRPSAQGQVRPAGIGAAGLTPSHPGGQDHRFGHDSSSSSPSFPCSSSGGPASLIQLYSDIIPDDKPKKKRSRKRDGENATSEGGARTPLSSHSDDITAPPTPAVSDTSCSTPTRGNMDQSDLCFSLSSAPSGLAPSTELERQLSVLSAAQQRGSVLGMECQRGGLEVKEEREEGGACGGGVVKMEECGGDGGKELLRHLLKDKTSPATTPPPTGQAPPTARRQLSNDSVRSEEEDQPGSHGNMVNSPKKTQRCKRQPEKERAPPKHKRRKKEEEEKMLHSDPLMTHLTQLAVLPLMEPVLGLDLSLFPPYGSSPLGKDSRLSGSFGNGCLDGVTDYYSQLIYKQNNLSNPPTPPASLPPTPPPVARQKLVNGFATSEELTRKDLGEQDCVKQKGGGLLSLNHASKTVDVPASLPTPPHNTQEDLRVQDSSGRDSPDGYIPSSSPESMVDAEVSRYPDLSFIKLEPPSPCPSPTLPIMPCAWGKGSAVKQEVKSEPNHQAPPSCSSTDLVTIAITLNPVAAQTVAGVMVAVAELLRVPVPLDYQLSRPSGPERSSLALLAGVRVPLTQVPEGSRQQRPPPAALRPQSCSCCKVLLGNGVRIVKELKQEAQSRTGSSLVFCSQNCSELYTPDLQRTDTVPVSGAELPRVHHPYSSNMSSIPVHSLLHTPSSPPPTPSSSPPLSFPPASAITMETRPRMDSLKVKVKLKPRPRAVPGGEDSLSSRHGKRMKSCRWRRWNFSITLSRGPCIPNEAVAMPTEEEVDVLLKKLGACLRPDPSPKDQRRCCFCNQQGDGQTDGPARLLNLDLDLWVHLNCALWSSEVYETQAGALINVELALRRSLTLRCAHCQRSGATSGCNRLRCTNTYHFTCALQAHCTFFKDKTMLCHLHKPRSCPPTGASPPSCALTSDPMAAACDPYDCELRCFSVFRRVFVQRDEARQIAAVVQRGERQHTFRVGSLLFRAIGRLLPQQMKAFHNQAAIFPIGYHADRIYWSMRHSNRRCKYVCAIEERDGRPLFKVTAVEAGYDDLTLSGPTPKAVWDQVLEPVSQIRSSSGTLKLFPVYLKGEDLFGLTTSAVTRIIESLPGVETCERYTFRYGRNPLMEWPLAFNPSGSARSEPKACQAKRPTLLTSVAPRCQGSVGSIVGLVPGVISLSPGESVAAAHQGRHSKSAQYRRMKADWKTNVYLARSRIQGLGLYAARDIEKCTMVIEYIGTIIRSEVANRKERLYESQNRGVYMFRIDNDFVIDATITGGPARYINHSCSPNCITEVVSVEKENKIIISSCRRIQRGEELSYDYKFDLEDDQHKIPCHCGAVNCRKWMN